MGSVVTIRLNDKSVKELIKTTYDIHGKVSAIEIKCANMEKHLETINGRLNKHAGEISDLQIEQGGIKVRMWLIFIIGSGIGGIVGTLITKFIVTGVGL